MKKAPSQKTQGFYIIKISYLSSLIQTILSVLELHQINACALADYTAGGESHPALKNPLLFIYRIAHSSYKFKSHFVKYHHFVCAPLFLSPKHVPTAKLGFRRSEQPFAQGRFSTSSAGLSACSGNLLIFLPGCAAYRLLFKQTRALRSNSVFKAIALLAKPSTANHKFLIY